METCRIDEGAPGLADVSKFSTPQFPNLPQLEDYHIIDRTDDHLLIIFCHGMPEANLNGALVRISLSKFYYRFVQTFKKTFQILSIKGAAPPISFLKSRLPWPFKKKNDSH